MDAAIAEIKQLIVHIRDDHGWADKRSKQGVLTGLQLAVSVIREVERRGARDGQ